LTNEEAFEIFWCKVPEEADHAKVFSNDRLIELE